MKSSEVYTKEEFKEFYKAIENEPFAIQIRTQFEQLQNHERKINKIPALLYKFDFFPYRRIDFIVTLIACIEFYVENKQNLNSEQDKYTKSVIQEALDTYKNKVMQIDDNKRLFVETDLEDKMKEFFKAI